MRIPYNRLLIIAVCFWYGGLATAGNHGDTAAAPAPDGGTQVPPAKSESEYVKKLTTEKLSAAKLAEALAAYKVTVNAKGELDLSNIDMSAKVVAKDANLSKFFGPAFLSELQNEGRKKALRVGNYIIKPPATQDPNQGKILIATVDDWQASYTNLVSQVTNEYKRYNEAKAELDQRSSRGRPPFDRAAQSAKSTLERLKVMLDDLGGPNPAINTLKLISRGE